MSWPLDWPPTYLQVFLIISLPTMGLVYALLGSIKLPLAQQLDLDEGRVGKLVSGFGMMVGPIILACGFLADDIGRMPIWIIGSIGTTVAVFILANARTFKGALIGVCVLGAGWSATVNVGNVLMRASVGAESVFGAVHLYDFIFGAGAFVAPIIVGVLIKKAGFQKALVVLGVVAILTLGLGFFAEMHPEKTVPSGEPEAAQEVEKLQAGKEAVAPPEAKAEEGSSESHLANLFAEKFFWVIALAFLFYVPLESSTAGWATTLIVNQRAPDEPEERLGKLASGGLLAFWLCFSGSRLVVALVCGENPGKKFGEGVFQSILLILAIACVALMAGLVFLRGRGIILALVVLAGLVFGPVFPAMMSMLFRTGPPEVMGRAVGFFFFFGSIGWTVIPMMIGGIAKRRSIQSGFMVALGSSVVFLILVIIRGTLEAAGETS